MAWMRRWCGWLLLLVLAGCAGTSSQMAPVERPGGGDYVVKAGDNLHGIAFARGVTVREIVAWNHISNPDLIHPGQRLRMSPAVGRAGRPAVAVTTPVAGKRAQPVVIAPLSIPPQVAPAVAATNTRKPVSRKAAVAKPAVRHSPPPAASRVASKAVAPSVKHPPAKAPSANLVSRNVDGVRWTSPTRGKIIKGYSASSEGKKGINIAGREGQRVVAAAAGKIVYAGSGLGGYGQLIIIEHNKKYLSAYAHNSVLKAKEGDSVTLGQTIAAMGKTGTSRVMLHFEIRRDGKAVDPGRYLPAQNP